MRPVEAARTLRPAGAGNSPAAEVRNVQSASDPGLGESTDEFLSQVTPHALCPGGHAKPSSFPTAAPGERGWREAPRSEIQGSWEELEWESHAMVNLTAARK
ncbi:hypothetical protein EVAR_79607_1 [Eumeta japonica]|uniref:Uncharacterized protein n=1 Tax=Eumeta variegata TaxID=151549 RepID=A0A4C1UF50_EUMVA|nr:hypothetical protein EVAR_79607_1 [Eumeta japonica]